MLYVLYVNDVPFCTECICDSLFQFVFCLMSILHDIFDTDNESLR